MGGFQPMDQDGQVKDDCMVQQRNYRPLLPAAGKKNMRCSIGVMIDEWDDVHRVNLNLSTADYYHMFDGITSFTTMVWMGCISDDRMVFSHAWIASLSSGNMLNIFSLQCAWNWLFMEFLISENILKVWLGGVDEHQMYRIPMERGHLWLGTLGCHHEVCETPLGVLEAGLWALSARGSLCVWWAWASAAGRLRSVDVSGGANPKPPPRNRYWQTERAWTISHMQLEAQHDFLGLLVFGALSA